jgi:hypothetical protein
VSERQTVDLWLIAASGWLIRLNVTSNFSSFILKTKATVCSEMFPTYQTTRRNTPEDRIVMLIAARSPIKQATFVKLTRHSPLKAQGFPLLI